MVEIEGAALAPARNGGEEEDRLRVLWVVDPDFATAHHHGAVLRYYNYARELLRRGHQVYFMVDAARGDPAEKRRQLHALRDDLTITGHFETHYAPPRLRRRVASWLSHPGVGNRLLRGDQEAATAAIQQVVERVGITHCIFSNRDLLFAAPAVARRVPTVIDWADCYTLYLVRLLGQQLRRGPFAPVPNSVRHLAQTALLEGYYGRRVDANIVVSPVDRRWMDRLNGRPATNRVLLNGVHAPAAPRAEKVKGRLVFSGNMDFPPNYQAALWFIDEVLPRVVARRPDVLFVVAGANPVPALRAREGKHVHVTGFVDDLAAELARSELYVAPLVSGGGFKNKVVEAISCGTYVVGTSIALEFLPRAERERLVAADSPSEMARAVLQCLEAPERFEARLRELRAVMAAEFDWGSRAEELIALGRECTAARAS